MNQNVISLTPQEWEQFMLKLNNLDPNHEATVRENERFLREEVTVKKNNGITTIEIPWLSDEDISI